jgi:hypothetical protein
MHEVKLTKLKVKANKSTITVGKQNTPLLVTNRTTIYKIIMFGKDGTAPPIRWINEYLWNTLPYNSKTHILPKLVSK